MKLLVDDIRSRAATTPSLPAVRYAETMITYGQLDKAITSFESVMDHSGMSRDAALYAAIIHLIPSLAEISDRAEQGRVLDEVIGWLGRHLPSNEAGLRAVG